MLLQFAVENYRSIAGREVLSFLAVPGEPHPAGQVVEVPGIGPVLRSIVLYGANASGKSSVVGAFEAMQTLLLRGAPPGGSLPIVPHKLWPRRAEPSVFEFEWSLDGVRYAYGIRATASRVAAEWLVRVEGAEDRVIFERTETDTDRAHIVLGPGLDVDEQRRQFYAFVAEGTRHEQPFLAELRARNATELAPLFQALSRSFIELPRDDEHPVHASIALIFPAVLQSWAALLREAGTAVEAIELTARSPEIQRRIDAHEPFEREEAGKLTDGPRPDVRMLFRHRGEAGEPVALDLSELSDGTRRLLQLAPLVDTAGFYNVVFVDELDRSLHTQLTRFLMERLNVSGGTTQFVFTTHDTNLLDANVFGRDAIWFVEKDDAGASHLWSLASFDKRQLDALAGRIEEGYLQGRFGAIPFVSDPSRLSWSRA